MDMERCRQHHCLLLNGILQHGLQEMVLVSIFRNGYFLDEEFLQSTKVTDAAMAACKVFLRTPYGLSYSFGRSATEFCGEKLTSQNFGFLTKQHEAVEMTIGQVLEMMESELRSENKTICEEYEELQNAEGMKAIRLISPKREGFV